MFNVFNLKDFRLNKTKFALPKDEHNSQYGNLVILNTSNITGNANIVKSSFINDMGLYKQLYKDPKFIFRVKGKTVSVREIKERLDYYKQIKDTLDLKGIVTFNANPGKNMYYDISRFNQLFFGAATNLSNRIVRGQEYVNLLKEQVLSQSFVKDYTNVLMIIDVDDWKNNTTKDSEYQNPIDLFYITMWKDIETFKSLGNIEIIVTSSNAAFRFSPSRCDEKSFTLFRRVMNQIDKTLIDEAPETEADKALNVIGSKELVQRQDYDVKEQPVIDKNPEVIDAVQKASDKIQSVGARDSKANDILEDDDVKKTVAKVMSEPVNIKSDAMSKRDRELREKQRDLKISDGRTINELFETKSSTIKVPVNDVSDKVNTLNKNVTNIKFNNFARTYNKELYDRDIVSIASSMKDKSIPIYIRDVKKEDTSDSLNLKETWTFSMEDENRNRHTLKFDVPKFIDDRFMLLNGNKKEFNNQRFLKPIVKTGPDTVQICTNYNKIFMTRYGEKVESLYEKFKQLVMTDTKRFSYKRGDCSRLNNDFKTSIEYDTLAKTFSEITCKSLEAPHKPLYKLIFDQNRIKEMAKEYGLESDYNFQMKNDRLAVGFCYAYIPNKKEPKVILYSVSNDDGDSVEGTVTKEWAEGMTPIEKLHSVTDELTNLINNGPNDEVTCARIEELKKKRHMLMGSRLVTESQSLVGNIRLLNRKEYPDMYDGQEGNYPYGYFEDNRLIGKIRVTHSKGSDFYGLSRFAVEKESRGKGVGSKLLRYVIDKYGKFKLVLNVLISNDNAISLYKKNGFKITYTNNNPTIGDKYYVMTRNGKSAVHESSSVMENEYDVCTEKLSYFVDPRSYSIGDVTFVTDKDGTSNAGIKIKGKLYRVRVEAIVFKDGKIYAEKLNKIDQYGINYKIPGGSIEPGLSLADSCAKECNEEMKALVTNVKYTGISYKRDYNGNYPKWHIEKLHPEGIIYEGVITCVFTAEYDGKYTGRIEEVDKDSLSKNGRWYLPSELDLSAEHISAIRTVVGEPSSVMENSYSDFSSIDDLASFVSNIEEVPKEMDDTFKWPKDIFRDSIGNCVDVALFVHYYCNECHIPNKLIRLTLEYQHDGKGPVSRQSHVVCGYEIDGKWSILQNSGLEKLERNIYSVSSTSIDTTIKRFSEEYMPVLLGYLKSVKPDIVVRDAYYSILTDSAMQRFDDKYYGNKSSDKQSIISSLFNKVGKTALKSSVYKESLYPLVITESSTGYSDAKSVYDSLSDKDKKLVSPSGRFVDSPALVYRYVHKVNNAVAGFIDCYKYNGSSSISAFIVYAISLRFRGKGISKILLDKAVNGCKEKGYKRIVYRCAAENVASAKAAESYGFKLVKSSKNQKSYVMNIGKGHAVSNESSGVDWLNETVNGCPRTDDVLIEAYSPYGTFDELCEKIRTPKQLMNWFVKSKVHWPANRVGNSKMFVWPEKLIKTRTGNCYDIALFVHYWAEAVGIENFIGLMSWVEVGNRVPEESLGHAVAILKDEDEKYYIFDYYPGKYGLRGPYKTPTEALTYIANMANARASIMLDATTIPVSSIIPPSEMTYYDEIYGKEYRQDKFIEEKDGYHMRTHIKEIYRVTGNDIKALRFAPEDFLTGLFNKVGSLIVKGKSMLTEANDTLPDENIVGPGIVNNILSVYRASGNFDDKEFAKYKSGKKFMYTRCKVMKKNVPLIVFLAYCEGLTAVLRKAEIAYTFSDKRPRLEGLDAVNKGVVDFADGYLIYNKYPLHKSLLMNGLSVVQTKNINYEEMDMKDTYLDVFDSLFGARMLANALDNFYEWMIDVPTKEILDDLNYPTDFVGLLLAGNKLLADNNYRDEIDMANWRIRNNELVYAYAYKRIAEAYTKFRMTAGNKNPVKVTIPRNAVLKDVMMSQIVEDVSELSPIVEAEKAHTVTDKGPSGTNLEQAYTQERRCFHPSMKGVMAISTSPDANVGLMRELTVEPNIINARGYVAPPDDRNVNDVNLFSMAEMLTPLGVTRDDPIRTSMSSKQSKHIIPVENSSPVLMSNGIEKVLPYHLSTDFSVVAKDDGEVVERNEDQGVIIVKYKHIAGDDAYQVINMNTKVVKNGAGGFFLTNKLNCDKLKKGYRFKKNDILAYNKRFFSDSKSDGTRFNIGTLVKVACMGSYANFEDGDCITTKLSKKLGTEICMPCEAVIGANSNVDYIAKVGQAVGVNEPLVIFDQSSKDASFNKMLANIGEDLKEEITGLGKTPIKSKYAGVIQDIKIYSTIDLDEMSPSLRKIVARYYDGIKAKKKIISKYRKGDSLNDYTFTEQDKKIESEDGKIMGVTVGEGVLIRFFIKYHDNMDVGDKLVHFAALKCVNGEMIPEGLEPYTVNNPEEEISTTFAPAAVLARMVPSVMQTMYGNKIIIELKRRWLEMYKKDNPGFKPKDELY